MYDKVTAVFAVHGESYQIEGNAPNYANNLLEWQNDYNREIKNYTGQTSNIKLMIQRF